MKYLKNYEQEETYDAQSTRVNKVEGTFNTPNISYVTGNKKVFYNPKIKNVGDVCCAFTGGDKPFVIPKEDYIERKDYYDELGIVPIGIVVVPSDHMRDGYARVAALPDATVTKKMGDNDSILAELTIYDKLIGHISKESGENELIELANRDILLLPYFSNSHDYNYIDNTCVGYGLSPYINGTNGYTEEKNSAYFYNSTIDGVNYQGNAFSDIYGKLNTKLITQQTDSAKEYCVTYSPTNTNVNGWYIPALGEIGYMCNRLQLINDTLERISIHDYSMSSCWTSTRWGTTCYHVDIYSIYNTFSGIVQIDETINSLVHVVPFLMV